MDLCSVVKSFDKIVPKQLAEKWDNTGLLVEPLQKCPISTVFFTNDLTEDVLEEALSLKANLIVSYHPPLFTAFKSLSCKNWKDRIIMKCIANNIAIYSPHTACDAVEGGVNDWLLKCFDITCILPIKPVHEVNSHVIECFVKEDVNFNTILGANIDFTILMRSSFEDNLCYKILINSAAPTTVCQMLLSNPSFLTVTSKECALPNASKLTGMGRIGTTNEPLKLNECIQLVKNHLKLKNLRFALGVNCTLDTEISTVAVCAGSGASLLKGVPADLYITGEMSHHDLLDAIHKKTSVILCEHSNSERGYLVNLASELQHKLHSVHPDCKFIVSKIDKDPVSIV
ncbi:NIF3-like protein 1 [Caerostris extrusa]|uniref:NIF3-like protein 1 n=1 Tax=Caerostris extrusa TaxID=172846 RepID=A0AAV4NJF1_CAEEX|nr:NIF3-like protein 1 [Caerostris extrusa]